MQTSFLCFPEYDRDPIWPRRAFSAPVSAASADPALRWGWCFLFSQFLFLDQYLRMNAPPTFESFLLFDGEKKITREQDTKVIYW